MSDELNQGMSWTNFGNYQPQQQQMDMLPSMAQGGMFTGNSGLNYYPGQQAGMGGGMFANSNLGMNMGTAQLGLAGFGSIANLWSGIQAQSLAKKQFEFQKKTAETNIGNQIKSYNTALTDRARNRAFVEGQTPEQERDYVARNSMTR